MLPNAAFPEQALPVLLHKRAVPSSANLGALCLRGYSRATLLIGVSNATTVTGSAISLQQAKTIAGTPKALAFDHAWRALDVAANGPVPSRFDVANNTFTTENTNSVEHIYMIDVHRQQLDIENAYDCLKLVVGDATAASIEAWAILWPSIGLPLLNPKVD